MTRQPTPANILDNVLTTDATRPIVLRLDAIKIDGGTQMRASLNKDTVKEYQEEFLRAKSWGNFPPVIVFYDGADYWLGDGFHRVAAAREMWSDKTAYIHCDVRSGTRRDAILHAAGANASHGLRRTNADKRRAVETLLRDEEWAAWSDGEIARRCAVSQPFVSGVREKLTHNGYESPAVRKGADGRSINTENIGAKPGPAVPPIPTPTAKEYSAAVQAAQPDFANPSPAEIIENNIDTLAWEAGVVSPQDRIDHIMNPSNFAYYRDNVRKRTGFQVSDADINDAMMGVIAQTREDIDFDNAASAISNPQSPISNPAPPADAPLPEWAQEKPAPRIRGYSVIDDYALRDMQPAPPANVYAALTLPDSRIPAARHLMALYGAVIDSEEQYGELTGRFSDTLGVKRDLTNMIAHLADLIAAIEHPEEVTPDA